MGMMKLRRAIGALGLALPYTVLLSVLVFGESHVPHGGLEHLSSTHYSPMYLLFEGLMILTAGFLFFYDGHDIKDKWICKVASVAAMITAFFPSMVDGKPTNNYFGVPDLVSHWTHIGAALVFFAMMATMVGFQFTKTGGAMTRNKRIRNGIYWACFWLMIAGTIMIPLRIFWFYFPMLGETILLTANGVAWLVKSGAMFRDEAAK